MSVLLQFIGDWGHALAAVLFAALGIFLLRRRQEAAELRTLSAALLLTSAWALYVSFGGVSKPLSGLGESIRNAAWLLAMFVMLRRASAGRQGTIGAVVAVYAAVAVLILIQTVTDLGWRQLTLSRDVQAALITSTLILRMMTAIGCLLLVHQLYTAWPARERDRVALLLGTLAAMWTYDFTLYLIGYFAPPRVTALYALRGLLMAVLAGVIAIGLRRDLGGRVQLSRTLTVQSLSAFAIALYVVLIVAVAVLIEMIAGPYARVIEIGAVFFAAVSALVLLPSPRLQALWRVQVAKHFFQHRYDYRTEWMRFGETIGRPGEAPAPLGQRVAKAVADITQSPGAILLLRDDAGGLAFETQWSWPGELPEAATLSGAVAARLEQGWIIDFGKPGEAEALPDWVTDDRHAWVLAPLIHYGRLIGAILLARPPIDRRLDWEDFDLLGIAARQVASYLAEQAGQEALEEAGRFDEFNRRIAFVMHDVKNLSSQMALLVRNAERHADNPEFRKDMLTTLRNSTDKLGALVARLGRYGAVGASGSERVDLAKIAHAVAQRLRPQHDIHFADNGPCPVIGDADALDQAIAHLAQNAVDASGPGVPVRIEVRNDGVRCTVSIADAGEGMSAHFVRNDLFRPFVSTKAGGFGIGAHEAKAAVRAMGGRLEVESREGLGTRFTMDFPIAGLDTLLTKSERLREDAA